MLKYNGQIFEKIFIHFSPIFPVDSTWSIYRQFWMLQNISSEFPDFPLSVGWIEAFQDHKVCKDTKFTHIKR